MAIRNIAHAINSGETSLGVAVGVESMSLKYATLRFLLLLVDWTHSPRPTPEVSEAIGNDMLAQDCIQVRLISG